MNELLKVLKTAAIAGALFLMPLAVPAATAPAVADDWCCENTQCEGGEINCIKIGQVTCFKGGGEACEA